jgi:RDD family
MGSALLYPAAALEFAETADTVLLNTQEHASPVPATVDELRRQVAERLAAHRSRRGIAPTRPDAAEAVRPAGTRSARIAATVAERYAQTPSYRAVLAAEAERATQQARAAAEVAAMNAQAVAAAQQRLLAAYDEHLGRAIEPESSTQACEAVAMHLWPEAEAVIETETEVGVKPSSRKALRAQAADPVPATWAARSPDIVVENSHPAGGFTVRLYEDAARTMRAPDAFRGEPGGQRSGFAESSAAESIALDEEIAFRHTPVFEEPAGPPVALPANLIEFPRQLVASRKARPRYAEGPLREEMDAAPGDGQLRIFEVDPAQISTLPEEAISDPAQWTSIWLDGPAEAVRASVMRREDVMDELAAVTLEPASLVRRGMAAAINFTIVATGTVAFAIATVVTLAYGSGVPLHSGLPLAASVARIVAGVAAQTNMTAGSAGMVAAVTGAILLLLYQALFFVFSTMTPGMRCVRIAFCTFEDGNPTRGAVRRRMLATLLSALPFGMGYAWAALDEERLTWHDRMSRMYLRQY